MKKIIPIKPVQMTPEIKCGFCTNSKCCTYVTEQLTTPRSKAEFDHLLWQVSHDNISVYKDSDGWFLLVEGRCEHLGEGGRCGIYEARPQVCRDYSNDYCEYDSSAEEGFDLYFRNHSELLAYCQQRFKRWSA